MRLSDIKIEGHPLQNRRPSDAKIEGHPSQNRRPSDTKSKAIEAITKAIDGLGVKTKAIWDQLKAQMAFVLTTTKKTRVKQP